VKSIMKLMVIAALAAPIVPAQQKAAAAVEKSGPVHVKRTPSSKAAPSPDVNGESLETPNQRRKRLGTEVPSPEEYPLTEALQALQASEPQVPGQRLTFSPAPQTKKIEAPKEYRPKTTVPPSATANDAIRLSDLWQNTRDTPAEGKDGRVVYSDGAGLPTVMCAPLRLCIIELQAGEKLTGEPQIGDSVRWNIEPANYGLGELTTPLIVIKPKAVGLDTNLVITTDRRSYYLRLISSAQDYVAKVSFDYPDDSKAKWSSALSKQAREMREAQFDKGVKTLADSAEALNLDYRIKGDESIRPIRVFDDGVHSYIQMNPAVLHREAPVLMIIGPDGTEEMVNYRVRGSVYIVDRLFERARLILGSGRKARKADIICSSVKDRRLFARNPFRRFASQNHGVDQKDGEKSQ
jgi:type IV secretion system protein TrbG